LLAALFGLLLLALPISAFDASFLRVNSADAFSANFPPSSLSAGGSHQATSILSKQNEISDFYAYGSNNYGDSLNVSSRGGLLKYSNVSIYVTPWQSVYWEKTWYIFLANVSSSNFYIVYLYLHNSSGDVNLRVFDYSTGTFKLIKFNGVERVYNRTVKSPSVSLPELHISASPKCANRLFAAGPRLYVTSDIGYFINETVTFTLYPIYNQYNVLKGEYNELWTLMTDNSGNYYYSIFYMRNSDKERVLVNWILRLNDYAVLLNIPQILDAKWSYQTKTETLTVQTPYSNIWVKIDRFPFKTDVNGIVQAPVSPDLHIVEVQNSILESGGTRMAFNSWGDGYSANPRKIVVERSLTLTANFKTQYRLSIDSLYGTPTGAGWYDAGSTAKISVSSPIDYGNGTRHVFTGWSGDLTSNADNASILMDKPKSVIANWKKQHQISFAIIGLPNGTPVAMKVNDATFNVTAPYAYRGWFDSGTSISFSVLPTKIDGENLVYALKCWLNSAGVEISSPQIADKADAFTAVYSRLYLSSISCQLSSTNILLGDSIFVSGSITPPREAVKVIIYSSVDNSSWSVLTTAITDRDGKYSYRWTPSSAGTFYIKAYWEGDEDYYEACSPQISIVCSNIIGVFNRYGDALNIYLEKLLEDYPTVRLAVKVALYPVSWTFGLAEKTYLIFSFHPKIALIAACLVAGFFIGLVYSLPLLLALLAILKRLLGFTPKIGQLKPLAIIWLISAAVIILGGIATLAAFTMAGAAVFTLTTICLPASIIAIKIIQLFH
jgi:hypothetical protein